MNHTANFFSESAWEMVEALCTITCTKGTRRTGEASPQLVLGELQAQLYNSSLLFFSLPFSPFPGSSFPQEDMKASRRRGHGPVQAERACHCQTSVRSK